MGLALALIAVAVFVGGGAILYAVGIFNTLVQVRHNVAKAWKNIDVLLQQRHDEIPKLVEVCKGFMTHEREVGYSARSAIIGSTRVARRAGTSEAASEMIATRATTAA